MRRRNATCRKIAGQTGQTMVEYVLLFGALTAFALVAYLSLGSAIGKAVSRPGLSISAQTSSGDTVIDDENRRPKERRHR